MIVTATINTRFQLLNNSIAVLHKFIGPNYIDTVISPEVGSQARQVISQYSAQEVYTSREIIQEKLRENVRRGLGANLNKLVQPEAMEQPDPKNYNDSLQYSIQILDTLVLSIELPPAIVGAINRQTEQFYLIQEYRHRVAREAEESKRKQIEANGIAAFQKTVSQGISDSYLRWRGIEATLALAQSPELEGRGDRQRQGRVAYHPWQCRRPRGASVAAEGRQRACHERELAKLASRAAGRFVVFKHKWGRPSGPSTEPSAEPGSGTSTAGRAEE